MTTGEVPVCVLLDWCSHVLADAAGLCVVAGEITQVRVGSYRCWGVLGSASSTVRFTAVRRDSQLAGSLAVGTAGAWSATVQVGQRGEIELELLEVLRAERNAGERARSRAETQQRLFTERLVGQQRRLPVPEPVRRVAIVGSSMSAGLVDFTKAVEAAGVKCAVFPVPVNGIAATGPVAEAVRRADSSECDVIVVLRGGGATVDMEWADSYEVCAAVAAAATPVWVAVGHATDSWLLGDVANRSFTTPTAAGEALAQAHLVVAVDDATRRATRAEAERRKAVAIARTYRVVLAAAMVIAVLWWWLR